jgi:hypothetical protein
MNNLYENYLLDLGTLVREIAVEAREKHEKEDTEFTAGYRMGMYRMVTLMQQQADAFGIPLDKLKLDDFDPDQELIR